MKAIMLSVQPQWLEMILNKTKTIEIRKSIPNCKLPIDVYIYCTKKKSGRLFIRKGDCVYGEFAEKTFIYHIPTGFEEEYGGKVVAKFTLNKVKEIYYGQFIEPRGYVNHNGEWVDQTIDYGNIYFIETGDLEKSCLYYSQLCDYGKGKPLYAWQIDNLVIFDTPKALSEFTTQEIPKNAIIEKDQYGQEYFYFPSGTRWHNYFSRLTKAPQSWQFIEVAK